MNELVAICDICQTPINDDEGHLYATFTEIRAHYRDPLPTVTLGGIDVVIAQPMPIRWYARHYGCTPSEHEIGDLYQIEIEQVRTWAKLAEWTRHLSEKTWHARSDWAALVMACAVGRRTRITQAFALSSGA